MIMEKVNVFLGTAPTGEKTWGVMAKNNEGHIIAVQTIKSALDKTLPNTKTNEEYHLLVAEYASLMYFDLLKKYDVPFEKKDFCFDCEGQIYYPVKA